MMSKRQVNRNRLVASLALIGVGAAVLTLGIHLEMRNPRSNAEDNVAWLVLAVGVFLIGAGVGLPFRRPILVGIAFPMFAWPMCVLLFWATLLFGQFDQRMAVRSGYERIPEARQIDQFLGEADHFISGYKNTGSGLEWCTDVYFDGRYEFGMRVDVDVDRRTSQVTGISRQPRFYLHEVKKVDILPDGRAFVSYRAAGQKEFGAAEWKKVVEANGDFSVIGIQLMRNNPVPNFDKYVRQLPHRRFGP